MRKAKIRDRRSRVHGTRLKVGNQRYIIKFCSINSSFEDSFKDYFYGLIAPTYYDSARDLLYVDRDVFYQLISHDIPSYMASLAKKCGALSILRVHNCSSNYSYDIMFENGTILCFPRPVGFVIPIRKRWRRR